MKQSLYIYNNGDLKRKDNTLQFTTYEGDKRDIPIERISDIYILSEMSFNTAFINYISQYGIPLHFFNYYNFYTGSYYLSACICLITLCICLLQLLYRKLLSKRKLTCRTTSRKTGRTLHLL